MYGRPKTVEWRYYVQVCDATGGAGCNKSLAQKIQKNI